MKSIKKITITAVLLITGFSINFLNAQTSITSYRIENPQALKSHKLEINTDFDFFWGKFVPPFDTSAKADITVEVPSDWNKYPLPDEIREITKTGHGSGTYRIRLTNLTPGTKYVFPVYKLAYTAFKIYADNNLIYQSGNPAEEWENSKAQQYYETAGFYPDSSGNVLLTFYISNDFYRKGGFRGTLSLYEEQYYRNHFYNDLCTHSIFTGILIMISIYCLVTFFLKKEKSTLYLAVLILSVLSRIIFSSFPLIKILWPDIPFSIMLRAEYISVFFIPAFLTLYLDTLNKFIFKKFPAVIIAAPSAVFLILDILLPIETANRIVPMMQIYMYITAGLDGLLFLISLFRHRNYISTVCFFSLAIIGLGATSDILLIHHASFMQGIHLLTPAFLLFSLFQIYILAYIQNKNDLKVIELNNYLQETNQAYYRFVPKEFLELLCKKDITEVTLGEYKISKAAVLSADIRNFTSTSEKLVPIQVFDLLNSYLCRVAPLIRKYNGIIEKYLGDGIIAIFPDSAESALNCAIEMQEEMIELRQEFSQRGIPQIKIGIGIHYGDIVIGTGGNSDRMTEISLSKDIDIAIKTEAKTKTYHRPILATYEAISFAAKEARTAGRKFNFFGLKIDDSSPDNLLSQPAAGPAPASAKSVLFSIYNESFENTL